MDAIGVWSDCFNTKCNIVLLLLSCAPHRPTSAQTPEMEFLIWDMPDLEDGRARITLAWSHYVSGLGTRERLMAEVNRVMDLAEKLTPQESCSSVEQG